MVLLIDEPLSLSRLYFCVETGKASNYQRREEKKNRKVRARDIVVIAEVRRVV